MFKINHGHGLTGEELKEILENMSDEDLQKKIFFAYDYGDHWHTQVAAPVITCEMSKTTFSEYHGMQSVINDDDEDDELSTIKNADEVILIS